MDKQKAKKLEEQLLSHNFNGYMVEGVIGSGKSAAVFRVKKDGKSYALKIFDNELVERYGNAMQEKRIEQEISLKGHSYPNLVKIFDGGSTEVIGQNFYYILMELVNKIIIKLKEDDFCKK